MTIKWGIIGCGNVTELKSGPAFAKIEGSELVAVMRRNSDKAQDYALRHGVKYWHNDAQQLINNPEVNAIYIATPPSSHLAYALAAIKAGKPVYVEKPMCLNSEEAKMLHDAATMAKVKLVVAHYRRAQPLFLHLKSLIEQNTIGQVRVIELKMLQPVENSIIAPSDENWRVNPTISGGGLFHDLAPHQIDLMHFLFGDFKSCNGICQRSTASHSAEDIVVGNILFEKGMVFNGTWAFCTDENSKIECCEIYGSHGKITFSVFGHEILIAKDKGLEKLTFEPLLHVQQPMIEQVVKYFQGSGENPCSGEIGVKIMHAIDRFTCN